MRKVLVPLTVAAGSCSSVGALSCRHHIRTSFLSTLIKYELLPVLLPVVVPQVMIDRLFAECTGLLLMGGDDLDPAHYGEDPHPQTRQTPSGADIIEIRLVQRALEEKKPIIGICRGAHVVNVALGGTLVQHIPDLSLSEQHLRGSSFVEHEIISLLEFHDVIISSGTRTSEYLQRNQIRINSAHHQSVKKLGNGLVASGKTPEGIVEIIEHEDSGQFCFGLQSHPELEEHSALEPIVSAFVDAVKTA